MSFPFDNGWRIGDLLPTASTARPANHWLFLTRVKDGYAERNRQRPCRLLYRCDSLEYTPEKKQFWGNIFFVPGAVKERALLADCGDCRPINAEFRNGSTSAASG
jgi:hypothetical protein